LKYGTRQAILWTDEPKIAAKRNKRTEENHLTTAGTGGLKIAL
jgi:hypothetical protein